MKLRKNKPPQILLIPQLWHLASSVTDRFPFDYHQPSLGRVLDALLLSVEYPNTSSLYMVSASMMTLGCSECIPPSRSEIRSSGMYESWLSSSSTSPSSSRLKRLFTAWFTSKFCQKSKQHLSVTKSSYRNTIIYSNNVQKLRRLFTAWFKFCQKSKQSNIKQQQKYHLFWHC